MRPQTLVARLRLLAPFTYEISWDRSLSPHFDLSPCFQIFRYSIVKYSTGIPQVADLFILANFLRILGAWLDDGLVCLLSSLDGQGLEARSWQCDQADIT